jgi:transcriptional regulator GlxA family with amidase domain
MKTICFLIPQGTLRLATLFGVIEVFEKANIYAAETGQSPFYDIKIAGVDAKQNLFGSNVSIRTDNIKNIGKPHLILLPPIDEITTTPSKRNKELLKWLVDQYDSGTEIASLCTGAFMLAFTGLLKDKECSTHWRAEHLFVNMFPGVKLLVDRIITDNKGIYSAGGAASSLNLALYLIEKYNGRAAALYCSKILAIDIERSSQSQFILFEGQKDHADEVIKKIQLFVEKNLEEKITVDFLANKFLISKRSLIRRFKKATNNAPLEYIQRVKMEASKRSLELSEKTISEIMYSVGYNDVKAFRVIFKKVAGLTPAEYRNKYLHRGMPVVALSSVK